MPLGADQLADMKQQLEDKAKALDVYGLILIATEGINATVAGPAEGIFAFKEFIHNIFGEMRFKDSPAESMPFKRFKVKIKDEIVQLKRTDIQPTGGEPHVSAQEWDNLIDEDAAIIDVRNTYETKIGTFKNAMDPKTEKFSEFPQWVEESGIPKDKKIGIFCTGGIRCEKAAVAMKELGYKNVYQLDGGILDYIEQRPNQNFTGECFVFDHRMAVGQDLAPSKTYVACWSCGNTGHIPQVCVECEAEYKMCEECIEDQPVQLCSKNCRYKYQVRQV